MRMGFLGHEGTGDLNAADARAPMGSPSADTPPYARELEAEFVELPVTTSRAAAQPERLASLAEIYSGVAACRLSVAEALIDSSKEYRALCALVQSDIPACAHAEHQLRRKLATDIGYAVLGKLDEALSIALANGGAAILAGISAGAAAQPR
jgi:hypothetical protein